MRSNSTSPVGRLTSTVRACRVDTVIERVLRLIAGTPPDPLVELLADLVERGELTISGVRALRVGTRTTESG